MQEGTRPGTGQRSECAENCAGTSKAGREQLGTIASLRPHGLDAAGSGALEELMGAGATGSPGWLSDSNCLDVCRKFPEVCCPYPLASSGGPDQRSPPQPRQPVHSDPGLP